jgi:hypothetical protein
MPECHEHRRFPRAAEARPPRSCAQYQIPALLPASARRSQCQPKAMDDAFDGQHRAGPQQSWRSARRDRGLPRSRCRSVFGRTAGCRTTRITSSTDNASSKQRGAGAFCRYELGALYGNWRWRAGTGVASRPYRCEAESAPNPANHSQFHTALRCNTQNAPCSVPALPKNPPCSLVRENSFQSLETIRKGGSDRIGSPCNF